MPNRALNNVIRELGVWSKTKSFTVRCWAKNVQQNLRRLKRYPDDKALLVQTAKSVEALLNALHP